MGRSTPELEITDHRLREVQGRNFERHDRGQWMVDDRATQVHLETERTEVCKSVAGMHSVGHCSFSVGS